MRGLWYGDRRDRVKWGALVYLAQSHAIDRIIQVAYYRNDPDHVLVTPDGEVPLPLPVWQHFSDLQDIRRLAEATKIEVDVVCEPFDPLRRREYISAAAARIIASRAPKIVFLDPDTGIEPGQLKPEHAAKADLEAVWSALSAKDVLAVYQHRDHTSKGFTGQVETLTMACGNSPVQCITGPGMAADVAMLWCEKRA